MGRGAIGLGWRVHSWWAVVVAVSGPAASPTVVHRERVTLLDDTSVQEPYHAAAALPLDEVPALIGSVEQAASAAAVATIRGLVSSLGPVEAVGVVRANRRLPTELPRILASHALLHACERDLYERAIVEGATRAGLPVATIPATGALLGDASRVLGVALEPSLAAVGKSIGPPWQKDHKEATAAALVALHALAWPSPATRVRQGAPSVCRTRDSRAVEPVLSCSVRIGDSDPCRSRRRGGRWRGRRRGRVRPRRTGWRPRPGPWRPRSPRRALGGSPPAGSGARRAPR